MNSFNEIQALLQDKADIQARIKLIPYDGNPEVKENASGKYLYIRKRVGSRLTSTYVDAYSEDLYQLLLRNAKELRELKKSLRKIEKRLAELGYEANGLSNRVLQNIDFARANMKANIYDQAILEGVATSYPQTEDILEELLSLGGLGIQYCIKSERAYAQLHEIEEDMISVPYSEFNEQYNQRDIEARDNMRKLVDSEANKVTKVFSTLL